MRRDAHVHYCWLKHIVERLGKEDILYKNEVEEQKRKLDKLTAEGAEDWDIKNAVGNCTDKPMLLR